MQPAGDPADDNNCTDATPAMLSVQKIKSMPSVTTISMAVCLQNQQSALLCCTH